MATCFEANSHVSTRALQIYLMLVSLAWNRQTITYGALSRDQMDGYGTGGILDRPLGCIMALCHENELEPLTVLVVNDVTRVPGVGLITVPAGDWPAAQQRVFDFNWFSVMPPFWPNCRRLASVLRAGHSEFHYAAKAANVTIADGRLSNRVLPERL